MKEILVKVIGGWLGDLMRRQADHSYDTNASVFLKEHCAVLGKKLKLGILNKYAVLIRE